MTQISEAGLQFIRAHEGLRLEAYQDQAGVWTIGYGHTGPDVTPALSITLERAQQLLAADAKRFVDGVNALVKVPLTQNQFDALVSFAFNVGLGALGGSTLLRKLNLKDYTGAAEQFLLWNKVRINGQLVPNTGLTRRRQDERALFLRGS